MINMNTEKDLIMILFYETSSTDIIKYMIYPHDKNYQIFKCMKTCVYVTATTNDTHYSHRMKIYENLISKKS